MTALPDVLNVLVLARTTDRNLERIRAIAPERLNIQAVEAMFAGEEPWPDMSARRAARPEVAMPPLAERDAVLRDAHVALMGLPFPKNLPHRLPNLLWAHFPFAGVSNLRGSDWWQAPFLISSSRSQNQALPIAETMLGASFMLAKRLDLALRSNSMKLDGADFIGMKLIRNKTMAIIGLGGIGSHLARLAKGCGMRVIASRRSATQRQADVDGVDELYPPTDLHTMLAEADFVACCVMWTDETTRLLDEVAFAAMKPGAYFLNTARGEVLVESAFIEALQSGHLAGAYIDVWEDDFGTPPTPALLAAPNLVITPHISGRSDVPQGFSFDIFCDNLGRLLRDEPLINVVDWSRGY